MDWIDKVGWWAVLIAVLVGINIFAGAAWLIGSFVVIAIQYGGWPAAAFLVTLSTWLGWVVCLRWYGRW